MAAPAHKNVSFARSLLTRAEKETLAVAIHTRRQELQADLNRKRAVLDRLDERLKEMDELAMHGGGGGVLGEGPREDDPESDDGEDILGRIMAARRLPASTDHAGRPDTEPADKTDADLDDACCPGQKDDVGGDSAPEPAAPPTPQARAKDSPGSPGTQTSPTLRPRRPGATQPASDAAVSTSNSVSTSAVRKAGLAAATSTSTPTALFGDRTAERDSKALAGGAGLTSATTEAILDHHRAAQEALQTDMLRLAQGLKAASEAMSMSLLEDRELVERAGEGLGKTEKSMEAATQRMGTLRWLIEGEGWFGRMRLYAMVYGLMVALVLLVFALPKLR